jgi:hypothetical protein
VRNAGALHLTYRSKAILLGALLGILTGQACAYEPPTADGAMIYLKIPFDVVRGSDRVASVGLKLGQAIASEDVPSRVYRYQDPDGPGSLDFHFYRSDRGGAQLNGIGLSQRHDLSRFGIPLFVGTN